MKHVETMKGILTIAFMVAGMIMMGNLPAKLISCVVLAIVCIMAYLQKTRPLSEEQISYVWFTVLLFGGGFCLMSIIQFDGSNWLAALPAAIYGISAAASCLTIGNLQDYDFDMC